MPPLPKLTAHDLVPKVTKVLKELKHRDAGQPTGKPLMMTAYQILLELPPATVRRLHREVGLGGKGCGNRRAGSVLVQEALDVIPRVKVLYLDTRHVRFPVRDKHVKTRKAAAKKPKKLNKPIQPSADYCGLYWLP